MKYALFLAALLVFACGATAQTQFSPQGQPVYYTYPMTTDNAYAASDKDTLPTSASLTVTTPIGANLGGTSQCVLQLIVDDSAAVDVFADWANTGSSTFTNISAFTDSLINTSATLGKTQEYTLKLPATDRIGGIGRHIRFRISFRASGQGVTTPIYDANVLWKP